MYKKLISTLLIVILALSVVTIAAPDDIIELIIDNPQATVNGIATPIDAENSDVTPIIVDNRTVLPIRFIAEKLGMEVAWYEDRDLVVLSDDNNRIELTIESPYATANGEAITLEIGPIIYANRTYVPVRFIAETLGKKVDWDGATRKVTIRPRPPVSSPEDAFNGLKFRPVFSNGLAGSSFNFSSGFGMSIDTSSVSIVYGTLDNPLSQDVIDEFPAPADQEGLEYTVVAQKEFGMEKLALVSATSTIIPGEGVTIIGQTEFTSVSLSYLIIDEASNYFVFASIAGSTQDDIEELNSVLESYK